MQTVLHVKVLDNPKSWLVSLNWRAGLPSIIDNVSCMMLVLLQTEKSLRALNLRPWGSLNHIVKGSSGSLQHL